jgi:hypothetical protein
VEKRPDLNLDETIGAFRDYWVAVPGARGRKLDWEATFRNWVRNERRGKPAGEARGQDAKAAAMRAIAERERSS